MSEDFTREFSRAPLRGRILYGVDTGREGECFHTNLINVSEGGLLIDFLPFTPKSDESVFFYFEMPVIPNLANMSALKIRYISGDDQFFNIVWGKGKIVRSFKSKGELIPLPIQRMAIEFIDIENNQKKVISEYVESFSRNLGLFSDTVTRVIAGEEDRDKLSAIADILGYEKNMELSNLKMKIEHDLKSFEKN
ncbi:MAG: PilZ domain-containing protein [Halobacteriovoraceae bacterium]|nr:PilZ domain-containing protein [Halobacteriovoraceae bacterium]